MFVGLVTGANILGLNTMGDRFSRRVFRFGRQRLEMVAEGRDVSSQSCIS